MRFFAFSAVLAALLFAGCDQKSSPPPAPPPPANRPNIEIHAPHVDVKTGKDGTTVEAPGTDVHVEKKQP